MEDNDIITVLTREDLRRRGWTARQVRKQKPDSVIRVKHRGRPKFGHSLVNVLAVEAAIAEAKAVVAEATGQIVATVEPIVAVA